MSPDWFTAEEKPAPEPQVLSVGELTRCVRELIEGRLGTVWVEGEISNLRKQASGHQYFTLKDAQAQLSCVLFARGGSWRKLPPLSDGMQVRVRGAMSVYEARGQYQLNVQVVEAAGAGLLQAKFEALKRKLQAEGLFDSDRKRALPKFPRRIGIVTSPSGAALRDMLNILERRAPWLRVVIHPVRVQGQGAGEEIAAAVAEFNQAPANGLPVVDVIVVTRGGGSIEDLWEFNHELLARTLVASRIPTISAVGHEIDFTIADFAADLRAPTPSAAAELVAPDRVELLRQLGQLGAQIRRCVQVEVAAHQRRIESLKRAALFGEPQRRLNEEAQRVDWKAEALGRAVRDQIEARRQRLQKWEAVIRQHRPDQVLALHRQRLGEWRQRLAGCLPQRLADFRQRLQRVADMLRLLAPQTVLERGFSMTTLADGTLVQSIEQMKPGAKLVTRVRDGSVSSVVED